MSARRPNALVASPVLVGTITLLVTFIAVFLSYNATAGLPFVPTYDIRARVPDAEGLIRGNEVRVGGKRVGIVRSIGAVPGPDGRPVAELSLQLDTKVEPLRDDSRVIVRPRSPLGLKYLELTPGKRGDPIAEPGLLRLERASPTVELDHVLSAFDAATRRAAQVALDGLGAGLAGRGADLNAFLAEAPPLLVRLERVAANLSDRRTDLRRLFRAGDRVAGELAAAGDDLGPLVEDADTTAGAFANARRELADGIEELPPTEAEATRALAAARPVLRDAAALARDVRPGTRFLPKAAAELHAALDTGIPVLRRTVSLAGRLDSTLSAVARLSADRATRRTLERLLDAAASLQPTLEFAAPFQLRCNYLGLWARNYASTVSEGDRNGTWVRTLVVQQPEEARGSASPAPGLHANPYPSTAAPGQDGECEAGREVFLPGLRIGNVPGNQGTTTEPTEPLEEVGER